MRIRSPTVRKAVIGKFDLVTSGLVGPERGDPLPRYSRFLFPPDLQLKGKLNGGACFIERRQPCAHGAVLKEANGPVGGPTGAAARLGLKRTTLQSRM